MFERFTDRARRVVVLAQTEAHLLNHNYIGTEHLLLGLLHERDGVAAKALDSLGVSLDDVRHQVEQIIGRGDYEPSGHIPFTPRAKKVLELALREALKFGDNYIGTEHVLLGLVREGDGVAAQVLTRLAGDPQRIRDAVTELRSGSPTVHLSPTQTAAAIRLERRAHTIAGGERVGSQHMLLGMFDIEDSLAARVLAAGGLTRERAEELIQSLSAVGTSDEQPPATRTHVVTVRVEDEKVLVEIIDPDLADLMGQALTLISGSEDPEMSSDDPAAQSFDEIWRATRLAASDVFRRLALRAQLDGETKPPDEAPPAA